MAEELVRRRVLIVDDNTDLAEAMSKLLHICGFTTTTAYSGQVALERARSFRPDIILTDIGLPDMDGYELAWNLRTDPTMKQAMMIAISAGSIDTRAPYAQEANFDHFLIKPVDLVSLLQILPRSTS